MVETKSHTDKRPPFYRVSARGMDTFKPKFEISEFWQDNLLDDWLKQNYSHSVVKYSDELRSLVPFLQVDIAGFVLDMGKDDVLCLNAFDLDRCFVAKGGRLKWYEHFNTLYYLIPSELLPNGLNSSDSEIKEAIRKF